MENFVVSARKYRPTRFDEVVGQQHVTQTLANAIQQNHLAQALLFTGPRGVGKTTSARILARMINQDGNDDPGRDFSFNIFELDAASNNSVDDIRNLVDQVRFAPQTGKYKVYIIDEVHMLSAAAFNAFLKTLEEPPKHAIFILATTEKHKIIPTILSRCQIYDFKRITVDDIIQHLQKVAEQEGIQAEERALRIIAQKADGALRDALSIFDRIASYADQGITYQNVIENLRILDYDYYFRVMDLVLNEDRAGVLNLFHEILEQGFDGHLFVNGLAAHLRDLLVGQDERTIPLLEVDDATKQRYLDQARQVNAAQLIQWLRKLDEVDFRYKSSNHPRLMVELVLVEMSVGDQPAATSEKKKPEPSLKSPSASSKESAAKPQAPASEKPQAAPVNHTADKPTQEQAAPPPPEREKKASEPTSTPPQAAQETPKASPKAAPESAPAPKTKRKKSGGFSISDTLKGMDAGTGNEEEEVDPLAPQTDKPQEPFTAEALAAAYGAFVEKWKKQGKPRIVATLDGKVPEKVGENKALLKLENLTQQDYYDEVKLSLIPYLREQLNNYALVMETEVQAGTQKTEPYSPQEKYQYLLEKNPLLADLRKRLDLDLQ